MARRVSLDHNALRVSKPGWDVVTAPAEGLIFNSEWAQLGLLSTGTIDCNWNEAGFRYFGFGKTFSSPPPSILQQESATRVGNFSGYHEWGFSQPRNRLDGSVEQNFHFVHVAVQAGAIRVRSERINSSGGAVPVPDFRLRYWIFDFNL